MKRLLLAVVLFSVAWPLVGCGTSQRYLTPGAGAPLAAMLHEGAAEREALIEQQERQRGTDRQIAKILAVQPAADFPAHIVSARLQSSGYAHRRVYGHGHGRYSVVTTRDVETDEAFAKLSAMPGVAQFSPMTRLVLPPRFEDLTDLREAAATLHADLLLIYTLDTRFRVKDHDVGPLNYIALGNLRNQEAMVTTTASAAFLDVRTGYLYGTAEATASNSQKSSIWRTEEAVDEAREKTEQQAYAELVPAVEAAWAGIVGRYDVAASASK